MARWIAVAALLLGVGAATPAPADDTQDCSDRGGALMAAEPGRVVAACRRLADQGRAGAQHNLGVLYGTGRGVPLDYAEAAKWWRRAAEQGDTRSQNDLAALYNGGAGVPQDYAEALKWWRK